MIYQFATLIFGIPPSQIENERDFSLAGVIARARRASLTVENLSMLVFIKKNQSVSESVKKLEKNNIFDVDLNYLEQEFEEIEDSYFTEEEENDSKTDANLT